MRLDIPRIGGSLGQCVLCGESFLQEVLWGKTISTVRMDGFNADLPIHREKCLDTLKNNGPDWKTLPNGPLRSEFEKTFGNKESK